MRLFIKLLFVIISSVFIFQPLAGALNASDVQSLIEQHPYYDPTNFTTGCATVQGSAGTSSGSLVWPFATKDSGQYERVDQGWDIQSTPGAAVYAIATGTIHVFAPDSGGFGNDYPTEELDTSIGGPSSWVYYGHVHVLPGVVDKKVNAGDQIAVANTTDPQNGSAAPAGWLEIGFAQPNTDAPVQKGSETAATEAGQMMKDLLINARPAGSSDSSGTSINASCCSVSSNLVGSKNEDKIWNYFIGKGLSPLQAAGLMGNIQSESAGTWDPRVVQGSPPTFADSPVHGVGYGLAQWTTDARQQKLIDRAKAAGVVPGDLGVQLDYIWWELTEGPYTSVGDKLKASQTIQDATFLILGSYEAPANIEGNKPVRLSYAVGILTKYGSDISSAGTSDTSTSGCSSSAGSTVSANGFSLIKLDPPLATPGGQITPKGITLHWWGSGSGGRGIDALVSALRGNSSCGPSGCSVQIGITADGKVYQMTKNLTDLTYHAIGGNQTTFGIEIEGGPADFGAAGITKYPAKFNAVVATIEYLVSTYNLPLDGQIVCNDVSGVHPHKAYNSCPGALPKEDIDNGYFNAVMQKVRSDAAV